MALMENNRGYSLVICAYNPDERILGRCLQALQRLDTSGIETEIILVDNNSSSPVQDLACVQQASATLPGMQVIREEKQGVRYARMAAIAIAQGSYIVYVDYDNELQPDYLQQLKTLNSSYPGVGAWGPGDVRVDFIDGIDPLIEQQARTCFQEKHEQHTAYACIREWQYCYPVGTGLCTRTAILKEYIALAAQGQFTLTGRKKDELSSGEDTQMVLLCISKGLAAGISPLLRLQHLIPANRANRQHLQKLIYGTGICYATCLLEAFPEQEVLLRNKLLPSSKFARKTIKQYYKARWRGDVQRLFALIHFISLNQGIYIALKQDLPPAVRRIIQKLQLNINNTSPVNTTE